MFILKNILERIEYCLEQEINLYYKFKNVAWFNSLDDWAIVALGMLTILLGIFLKNLIRESETSSTDDYKVLDVKNETATHFFNYLSLYFLPCIGLSISKISDIFVTLFLIALAGIVYVSSDLMYINPILTMLKYNTYVMEVESKRSGKILKKIVITEEKDCENLEGKVIKLNQSEGKYTFYFKQE